MPANGDASLILAEQLIAAKLNLANGADASAIVESIIDADNLLATQPGQLPYQIAPSSPLGQQMVAVAAALDRYNNSCRAGGQKVVLTCPDAPVPALKAGDASGSHDDAVTISDAIAVINYIGTLASSPDTTNAAGARYGSDVDADGIPDGAEYDGSQWNAPDGRVSIADVIFVLSHVGDSCLGP